MDWGRSGNRVPGRKTATRESGVYRRPLAVVTVLFFMWGFLTCLNDILVPRLKSIFQLTYAEVMADSIQFLLGLLLVFDSCRKGCRLDRLSGHHGYRSVDHERRRIFVRACCQRC